MHKKSPTFSKWTSLLLNYFNIYNRCHSRKLLYSDFFSKSYLDKRFTINTRLYFNVCWPWKRWGFSISFNSVSQSILVTEQFGTKAAVFGFSSTKPGHNAFTICLMAEPWQTTKTFAFEYSDAIFFNSFVTLYITSLWFSPPQKR